MGYNHSRALLNESLEWNREAANLNASILEHLNAVKQADTEQTNLKDQIFKLKQTLSQLGEGTPDRPKLAYLQWLACNHYQPTQFKDIVDKEFLQGLRDDLAKYDITAEELKKAGEFHEKYNHARKTQIYYYGHYLQKGAKPHRSIVPWILCSPLIFALYAVAMIILFDYWDPDKVGMQFFVMWVVILIYRRYRKYLDERNYKKCINICKECKDIFILASVNEMDVNGNYRGKPYTIEQIVAYQTEAIELYQKYVK
jgi:hypothetical protein